MFVFPEGGFAEGGLAGLVGICRFAARVLIPRREEMPDQVGHDGMGVGWDGPSWQGGSISVRLW